MEPSMRHTGLIRALTPNRTYGIIRGPKGELLTFELTEKHAELEVGEWVHYTKEETEYRTRAVDVCSTFEEELAERLFL